MYSQYSSMNHWISVYLTITYNATRQWYCFTLDPFMRATSSAHLILHRSSHPPSARHHLPVSFSNRPSHPPTAHLICHPPISSSIHPSYHYHQPTSSFNRPFHPPSAHIILRPPISSSIRPSHPPSTHLTIIIRPYHPPISHLILHPPISSSISPSHTPSALLILHLPTSSSIHPYILLALKRSETVQKKHKHKYLCSEIRVFSLKWR
jgi:hypothetical protein